MKRNAIRNAALLAAFALAGGLAGYALPRHDAAAPSPGASPAVGSAGAGAPAGRKVLYWYDPMKPGQHFDRPGKSPYMDMDLVAKFEDVTPIQEGVRIDPAMAQNLGLRLATVERGRLAGAIDAPATVELNDRSVAIVQARSAGFVERVYARAPGDVIAAGDPLVDLLVPEWAGAQGEYLALRRIGDDALLAPARERLRLLGMPPEIIAQVEASGTAQPVVTIRAPIDGLIKSLDARSGMSIAAGAPLARINGLATVWLEGAIPEAQGGQLAVGRIVRADLAAFPGRAFQGRVIAVLPEANPESRTLRVRVELPNPDGRLKAGMYAGLHLASGPGASGLLVPAEAVIRTGTRNVVILALDQGRYRPVEVRLGAESSDRIIVLEGLSEGQKIVASGQFLIDSEAGFRGAMGRLEPPGAGDAAGTARQAAGQR
jgi:Cu(I)/Ag(I) efflux system membrane fusion protein